MQLHLKDVDFFGNRHIQLYSVLVDKNYNAVYYMKRINKKWVDAYADLFRLDDLKSSIIKYKII